LSPFRGGHGHAVVLETIPADGALLDSAPDQVVIRFNEPVALVSAQILNAAGEELIPAAPARVEGHELRIALQPSLAEGSYVASYRAISTDSHPVISLAALPDGEGYLIERFAVAPGLSLLDPEPIADTVIRPLLSGLTEEVQGFPPLPSVAQELDAIQAMYGGTVLKNEAFSEARLEAELDATPTCPRLGRRGEGARKLNREPQGSASASRYQLICGVTATGIR
jgi:methionine-rich copper-binding protein CopC